MTLRRKEGSGERKLGTKRKFEISPPPLTKVNFAAATAFVRKFVIKKKIIRLTGDHRGRELMLDLGYIIIEKEWYPT